MTELRQRLAAVDAAPLWEHLHRLIPPQPPAAVAPAHHWPYASLRPLFTPACQAVSAAESERRVLMLVHPDLAEQGAVVPTIYAGLQVLLPGEVAPNHRHLASALRFVVEGAGAFTMVDGQQVPMEEGDLVLTPSWTWHEHVHDGEDLMVWLDVLDFPLLSLLGASFVERGPAPERTRYGTSLGHTVERAGLQQMGSRPPARLHFPWRLVEPALMQLADAEDVSEVHGAVLRYVDADGSDPLPTMRCTISVLPANFDGAVCRRTGNTLYHVVRGTGVTEVDGRSIAWSRHDTFTIPTWSAFRHVNASPGDAVLFAVSDDIVLEKLNVFREEQCR